MTCGAWIHALLCLTRTLLLPARGHTLSAAALVVAVVSGPPRQGWLVAVGVAWGVVMPAIMACTVHWVSDVMSGFCCGLAIALAVLREQRAAAAQP